MKNIYLFCCFSFFALQGLTQEIQNLPKELASEVISNHEAEAPVERGGDMAFWSSDFSDATMWQAEAELGENGWEILTEGGGWFYGGNTINSDSGGEYAFVSNGDPNDGPLQGDYSLTTTNAIDVSTIESAVLEFQLYGARFTDSLKVQVSTDGENFITVGNHQDIGQLTAGGGSVTANPILRSFNITLDVQGESDLWLRFNFQTAASGTAYGWFIDDVNIFIPEPYDLSIGDVYTGDIIQDYEYTMTPLEQAHPINLGASMTNLGGAVAENAILHAEVFLDGGTDPVYTGDSDPINLTQGFTDLVWIFSDFVPSEIGEYTVTYEVLQDSTDLIPADNTSTKPFMITDYTWANDDYNNINTDFDGALGTVTAQDEWILGTSFTVFEPGTQFQAASVSFGSGTTEGANIAMTLWRIGDNIEYITDSDYTITEDDASTFNTNFSAIEMDDQVELEVGTTYIIGLQHISGQGQVVVDCATFDNDFSTFIYGAYGAGGATDWFVFDDISPAIRLMTDDIESVNENSELNLSVGQNFPNPINGKTNIPFELKKSSDVTISILDITGKVVFEQNYGRFEIGNNTIELNNLDLGAGVYTYQVATEDFSVSRRLVSN